MKMPSKAFMQGFAEGFASPMLWLLPTKIERPMEKETSVEAAWRNVGEHLWGAIHEFDKSLDEDKRIEKDWEIRHVKVPLSQGRRRRKR